MNSAVYTTYGPPDVIHIKDVEKPVPKDHEVLIKVRAAAVNPLDQTAMRGTPYLVRLMGGLSKPKDPRLGVDVSGQIGAVGKNVTRFKPGDEIYGMCRGAFAEYVCAAESSVPMQALAIKPKNLTFEQAAAIPVAGLTALQALRDKGQLQPGQKVLINGAAGGVGTFTVQIAKSFGADVTGVCSTRNVDLVRSLGADRAIDYAQENFTESAQRYDLLVDCVGNHPLSACRRVLNPQGKFVVVGAPHGRWLAPLDRLLKALVLSMFVSTRKPVAFIASANNQDLAILRDLMESGRVTPAIDRCYSLCKLPEAIRYWEQGHARGKVVITVD
jgi:NADPH:quinone reductase-like Zn-dependent oxidoreductase